MNKNKYATFVAIVVLFLLGTFAFAQTVQAQQKKKRSASMKQVKVPNAFLGSNASAVDLTYYINPPWERYKRGTAQGTNGLVILNVDPQVKGGLWYYKDNPDKLPAGFTVEQLTTKDTGPEGIICGDMLSGTVRYYGYMCIDLAVSAKGQPIYALKYEGKIVAIVNCGNAFNPYVPQVDPQDCPTVTPCVPGDESTWTIVPDKDGRDKDGYGVYWKIDNCGNLHRYQSNKPEQLPGTVKCLGGYIFAEGGQDKDGNRITGYEWGWNGTGKLGKRYKVDEALNQSGMPAELIAIVKAEIKLKKIAWFEVGVNPCDTRDLRIRFFDKNGRSWIRDVLVFSAGFGAGLLVGTIFDGSNPKKSTTGIPPRVQPVDRPGTTTNTGGGNRTYSMGPDN